MIIAFKIIVAIYMVLNFFSGLCTLANTKSGETIERIVTCIIIIVSVLFFIIVANRAYF